MRLTLSQGINCQSRKLITPAIAKNVGESTEKIEFEGAKPLWKLKNMFLLFNLFKSVTFLHCSFSHLLVEMQFLADPVKPLEKSRLCVRKSERSRASRHTFFCKGFNLLGKTVFSLQKFDPDFFFDLEASRRVSQVKIYSQTESEKPRLWLRATRLLI